MSVTNNQPLAGASAGKGRSFLAAGRTPQHLLQALNLDLRSASLAIALALIWIGFDLVSGGLFLTPRNLYNLAVQSSVVAILSTGMVLVIVSRHIDLSVGSVVGFVGMIVALLQIELLPDGVWWNVPLSILAGLVLGAAIGLWQGIWITYVGVPSFVVTLAGLMIFRGAAFEVAQGRTVAPFDPTYLLLGGGVEGSIGVRASWLLAAAGIATIAAAVLYGRVRSSRYAFARQPFWRDAARIGLWAVLIVAFVAVMNAYERPRTDIGRGIPVPILILLAAALIMEFLARATRFGRHIYGMGGNPEAALLAGIKVRRTTILIFVTMGVLAGIAAVVTTARLNAGTSALGELLELNVIAAAVIGGASLGGGRGTIAGAILGAIVIQSLESGLVLVGASSSIRMIVIGLVLMVAVWFDRMLNQRAREA